MMLFQVKLSPQKYHVNRLTHKNRRWCRDATYLFSAALQIETNQIRRNMTMAFTHGKQVTKSAGKVVFENHDAWAVLDDIKCTPRYWQSKKRELYSKLDNLGPFQWFFTLSCADKRWPATVTSVILENEGVKKVVTNVTEDEDGSSSPKTLIYTTTDAEPVDLETFMTTRGLDFHNVIRENVIEATRYFDNRVKAFIREIVMGGANPLAIKFYSYRIEFQARGAAHVHGVLWADIDKLEETEREGKKPLLGLKAAFKALRDDKVPQHLMRFNNTMDFTYEEEGAVHTFKASPEGGYICCFCGNVQKRLPTHLQSKKSLCQGRITNMSDLSSSFEIFSAKKRLSEALEERIPMSLKATTALINYVDEFITCSLHKGSVGETVVRIAQEVQTHRHTQTCLKKGATSCRFNYPKFPSKETIIAKPYEEVVRDKAMMEKAKKELAKVRKVLENKELLDQVKFL